MSEISRRRPDQLGNLMTVLEFGAVDFDDSVRVPNETFRQRFHRPSLPRPGRPQKEKRSNRTPQTGHPRQVRLVDTDYLADGFILTYYPLAQILLKRLGLASHFGGFQ